MVGRWNAATYARSEAALVMFVHIEWARATRRSEGVAVTLLGLVLSIAEAGPGVTEAEELVAGPDGLGVQPHKARTGTDGGMGSREASPGVTGFLLKTGGTRTRVWWAGVKGDGPGTEEGSGSPLSRVVEPPCFCLTASQGLGVFSLRSRSWTREWGQVYCHNCGRATVLPPYGASGRFTRTIRYTWVPKGISRIRA